MLGLAAFPYYQHKYRGENFALAAGDIVALVREQPLYVTDVTSNGLNVTAYINQQRYPRQALQFPPPNLESGFIISMTADPRAEKNVKAYQLGGDKLYLLCRGTACKTKFPIK